MRYDSCHFFSGHFYLVLSQHWVIFWNANQPKCSMHFHAFSMCFQIFPKKKNMWLRKTLSNPSPPFAPKRYKMFIRLLPCLMHFWRHQQKPLGFLFTRNPLQVLAHGCIGSAWASKISGRFPKTKGGWDWEKHFPIDLRLFFITPFGRFQK